MFSLLGFSHWERECVKYKGRFVAKVIRLFAVESEGAGSASLRW